MTSLVEIALLGMTDRQKADLLKLHEHFSDVDHDAPRHLIDKAVRAKFVTKVAPRYWEFNELGTAIVEALQAQERSQAAQRPAHSQPGKENA